MSVKQEVKVEGMMCSHCEAHMEEAFKEIDGVISVKADHKKGTILIKSKEGIEENVVRKTVEEQEKTYLGIKTL